MIGIVILGLVSVTVVSYVVDTWRRDRRTARGAPRYQAFGPDEMRERIHYEGTMKTYRYRPERDPS